VEKRGFDTKPNRDLYPKKTHLKGKGKKTTIRKKGKSRTFGPKIASKGDKNRRTIPPER